MIKEEVLRLAIYRASSLPKLYACLNTRRNLNLIVSFSSYFLIFYISLENFSLVTRLFKCKREFQKLDDA